MDNDQSYPQDVQSAEVTAPAKKAPARRSRAKKADATVETAANSPADALMLLPEELAAPQRKAPVARVRSTASARKAATAAAAPQTDAPQPDAGAQTAAVETVSASPLEEAPAKKAPVRRSRAKKADDAAANVEKTGLDAAAQGISSASEPLGVQSETEPAKKAPARRTRTRKAAVGNDSAVDSTSTPAPEAAPAAQATAVQEDTAKDNAAVPAATAEPVAPVFSAASLLFQAPDLSAVVPATPAVQSEQDAENSADANSGEGTRSRRSRGRGGRNKNRTAAADPASDSTDSADDEELTQDGSPTSGATEGSSRRRRRRRRGDADLELTGGTDDDPPNTVTRVRAPRTHTEAPASNQVTSLRGSTRLEAKKQRRRESRDTGRRRQVITEAEFLARRESVDRAMVVRQRDDRIQIGVLEDGILAEHFVSKTQQDSLIGNVYLGKVQNVLPSMEAAFVDIGRGRNAVLYAGEVNWDAANLDGAPRRIENALKSGDSVLVQVSKDPVGHKGARLTSQISLPGRYLVYVPGGSMTGISRKLPDVERNRLKRILRDHLPENAGVIVRTAAEGASEEELTHDINRLRVQWEGIEARATANKTLAPEMLYGEPDLTIKVVRDVFNEDFSKLIVSGDEAWDTVEAYVTYVAPDLVDRLEKWTKDEDIFAAHRIDEQISKALERKVFLPSGGSLVIDRTEAMTVVDVNTGKFTGSGGNLEETVTKNNLEAAEEVVRQLRLRDIGGIIVIDFIDMVLESNRDLVLRRLVECLGRDRTKHQVAEVTSLGLIQMTRKRMGTGLLEVFGEQCEACAGRGVVTHDEPVEHRRSQHAQAADSHQVHQPQQRHDQGQRQDQGQGTSQSGRPSRSEKKRGRNRGNQQAEQHVETLPVTEPTDAERLAKANAARAALATIAAATHAAHHDDEHGDATAKHDDGHAASSQSAPASSHADGSSAEAASANNAPASGFDAQAPAVLTIGGQTVALPRAEHHLDERALDSARALAGLTQALDQIAEAPHHAPRNNNDAHSDHSGLDAQGQPTKSASRRGRRNRAASSPAGSASTSEVVQRKQRPDAAAQGVRVEASSIPAKPTTAPKSAASEPMILGVGVPASEL